MAEGNFLGPEEARDGRVWEKKEEKPRRSSALPTADASVIPGVRCRKEGRGSRGAPGKWTPPPPPVTCSGPGPSCMDLYMWGIQTLVGLPETEEEKEIVCKCPCWARWGNL